MKKKSLNVCFRADGNSNIGYGHIFRSLSLAQIFIKYGHNVLFVFKKDSFSEEILSENKINFIEIKKNEQFSDEFSILKNIFNEFDIDVFIGDSEDIDDIYLHKVKILKYKITTVVFDVLRTLDLNSDIIINGSIYAKKLYKSWNSNHLLGEEYAVLRHQFQTDNSYRKISKGVSDVLVTMGGADVKNFTYDVVRLINETIPAANIHIVVSEIFEKNLIDQLQGDFYLNNKTKIYKNVLNMVGLMHKVDLAFSACGTTLYELAATGTPTIGIIAADNQKLHAYTFEEKNLLVLLEENSNLFSQKNKDIIIKLARDWQARKRMVSNAQQYIDGLGSERCYSQIISQHFQKNN